MAIDASAGEWPDAGPADAVAGRIALERAFDRLDADARAILVLHHLDGPAAGRDRGRARRPGRDREVAAARGRGALERAIERENR